MLRLAESSARRAGLILTTLAPLLAMIQLAANPARAADPAAGCEREAFRVVVDVGHTAESPGARSARGVPEYEFNLALGKQIELALAADGFEESVLLVTAGAAHPSLYERVARANALPADLFVSIHHDSVPKQFLQKWDYAGAELPYSDRFKGHSIFISNENHDRAGSLQFAKLLGRQLKARDLHYTPHYTEPVMGNRRRKLVDTDAGVYRFDELIVLRTTAMPAVLLEAASIINRAEELQAGSRERQAVVAAAVASAVAEFCAARAKAAPHQRTHREAHAH
jgi:N-acetylmuramoyl-L-alanine amidase